ncbi:MAG: hypothetical protein GY775_18505 [Candidatus Scalindua sp.]|nr:hypothetical protein [Candidatus Scalindua sp.]
MVKNRNYPRKRTVPQHPVKLSNSFDALAEVENNCHPTPITEDSSMILGDSIVRGTSKYFSRPKTGRIVHVYPGARIDHVKKQVKKNTLPDKKSCVVVNVGSNDVYHKDAASEVIVEDYKDLISTLKDRADNIALVAVIPRMKVGKFALSRALHINDRLTTLCKETTINFIDPWDDFIKDRSLYQRFVTHLNSRGSKLLTSAINKGIVLQLNGKTNFC